MHYRRDLETATTELGHKISVERIGRIERNEVDPRVAETQVLCKAIGTTADYLYMGDPSNTTALYKRLEELPYPIKQFVFRNIDALRELQKNLLAER